MREVIETLEDYRPVYNAVMADPPNEDLLARYYGCELIRCGDKISTCMRAAIVRGPFDMELTLTMVDVLGWSYDSGWHYCPEHGGWR